ATRGYSSSGLYQIQNHGLQSKGVRRPELRAGANLLSAPKQRVHLKKVQTAEKRRAQRRREPYIELEMEYKQRKNLQALEGLAGSLSGHDSCQRYASGRVSSGTARSGIKVRIQCPSYIPRKRADLFIKSIHRTILIKGRYTEPVEDVPSGNILGLVDIDQSLLKSGTLSILGLAGVDQFLLKSGTLSILGLDDRPFCRFTESIEDVPSGNILGLVGIDQFLLKSGTLSISETAQCDDGEQSQRDRDRLAKRRGKDHGCHQGEYELTGTRTRRRRGEGELRASDRYEDSCRRERYRYRQADYRRHGPRPHGRDRRDFNKQSSPE
ncbi:hypothetical protein D0869_14828, partial [Hortaea werneckii]